MPSEPRLPSRLALAGLVTVAIVAPWPFGAVRPAALLAVTVACLLTAALALAVAGAQGGLVRPALPLWPALGFVALGLGQLVPLPASVHALLAPGSSAVWHPAEPAAAAVLGTGAHPISLDPDTSLRAVALVAGLSLLGWISAPALARPGPAVRAVAGVAVSGFCLSAYAIYARERFGPLLYGHLTVPTIKPFGSFVSKNHFAGYVEMAALVAAGLALGLVEAERARGRDWTTGPRAGAVIAAVVSGVAMALAVLASLSRGGVVSLGAGILAFAALLLVRPTGSRSRRGLVPALVLAAGLGGLVLAGVPPEAHERMASLGGASFRLDTWRDTVRMASSSPVVGQGIGAFHDAYPRFKRGHGSIRVEHAENDYLETLAEGGLVGLGLVLAAAVLVVVGGRGTGPVEPAVRGIGIGALAGLVALGVHSTVDFNLRIPSNAALAALLAGAAAGAAGVRARPLSREGSAALALGAIALLSAIWTSPPSRAREAREEAVRAAGASPSARLLRLERAQAGLVGVVRRRPAHAESWLMLAGVRAALGESRSAAGLARHALVLDPERPGLREAALRLVGGVGTRGSP